MPEQTNPTSLLEDIIRFRRAAETKDTFATQSLPAEADLASAAVISILTNRTLDNVGPALAALSEANSLPDNPDAIRRSLARQVPVLEALMHRLILSAATAKPDMSCRYLGTAMSVQSALLKVLGALYETREVSA